ncbi:zinc finger protein 200 isoform X2 [Balaenoptera acutorostrata]|uniref:Zinc finger protein 200 isoform X2 n=1 Tax=Balaenoptera acutorostrata TaxID=9767 RepID=A0A452CGP9_BALAC|nr:zinc finger protein 200 isoform X2 [Balaenoptera acutorostrata]
MAAKVVPIPPKPKRSFILRVPPNSKLGQDLLRDATSGPKTIHQLVLEHFLTFLPKPSLVQPSQKVKETLVIVKDVSSNLQNRVQSHTLVKLLPREGIQQKQEAVSLCLKAESEELVVFEDLNVFHSQEECVSLDPVQQPTSEIQDNSIGEMMLLEPFPAVSGHFPCILGAVRRGLLLSVTVILRVKIFRKNLERMKIREKSLQIVMKLIAPWSLSNLQIARKRKD